MFSNSSTKNLFESKKEGAKPTSKKVILEMILQET